jgi:hypothetical protein
MTDAHDADLLYQGEPPLTRMLADRLLNTIEKALGSSLTDEQRRLFDEQLINEWTRNEEAREGIQSTIAQFDEIGQELIKLPAAKQPLAWGEFGRQLYMYAEQHGKGNPVGEIILQIYQGKNRLLVAGSPPLSQQSAESYAEMSTFLQGVVAKKQHALSAAQKSEIVADLTRDFAGKQKPANAKIFAKSYSA